MNVKHAIAVWLVFSSTCIFAEQRTYTVKVMDMKGQAIAGAEVVALDVIFDTAAGQRRLEVIRKKTSDVDGTVVFNLDFSRQHDVCIAARKAFFAFAWDYLDRRELPEDGAELTILLDQPGVMSGIIVDKAGKAIAGARVRAMFTTNYLKNVHRIDAPKEWFTVETDRRGRFCFDHVPPDAMADFLVSSPKKARLYTSTAWGSMLGYHYAAGREDIRFVLPDEARVRGQVIDPGGRPVGGIRLLLRSDKTKYHNTNDTVSAREGRFLFENVPADVYSLQVVSPQNATAEWVGEEVRVVTRAGQTTGGIVVKVNKGELVHALVWDSATNRPVADAHFSLSQRSRYIEYLSFFQSAQTDHSGRASIRAPLGRCQMTVSAGDYFQFTDNIVVRRGMPRIDVELNHYPKIAGTVRDQRGRPVTNATICIVPPRYKAVRTDANGQFTINDENMARQSFLIARNEKDNTAAIIRIPEQTTSVDIALEPAWILTGKTTDPNGVPIPAARIQLCARVPGRKVFVGREVFTDSQGRYEIKAVPPLQPGVSYEIYVNAAGYGPKRKVPDTSTARRNQETIVLQPLNLSVSGIVIDHRGKPAPDRVIFASSPDRFGDQPGKFGTTDAEGRFSFHRVAKGPLRLQAGFARERDVGFVEARGGDRDVKIVLGRRGVHRPHASLVGKAMPRLDGLGLRSRLDVRGKRILICFWDINQRPSRHCIMGLARRSRQLQSQGIAVVAVQASRVDEAKLRQWTANHRIPFPMGIIQGDPKMTHLVWSIQSLPWLILTDRAHIVRAEGIALSEISDKIDQVRNDK